MLPSRFLSCKVFRDFLKAALTKGRAKPQAAWETPPAAGADVVLPAPVSDNVDLEMNPRSESSQPCPAVFAWLAVPVLLLGYWRYPD